MKAFLANRVTPLLVSDRALMERWKKAAASEKLIAKSKDGQNWVIVLDEDLAKTLIERGLPYEEWEEKA